MKLTSRLLIVGAFSLLAINLRAASEIVIGIQADFGALPGFFGAYEILHDRQNPGRQFLLDGLLRVAFFGLHVNSTDGDATFALDLNGPRFVRLSLNWAAPVPLPGDAAFLTLTENRYVPIPGTTKTANCSYIDRALGRAASKSPVRATENGGGLLRCFSLSSGAHASRDYDSPKCRLALKT